MDENKKPQIYVTDENSATFNDPFANMNMEKDELESVKKKNKIIIIVLIIIVFLFLIYIFADYIGDASKVRSTIPEAKENLEEVSAELSKYISDYDLDALDVYGMDDILMVAVNHVCYGVYDCKNVSASVVSDYIKNVFDKNIELKDIECSFGDGVLYKYENGRFVYDDNHPEHDLFNTRPIYTKVNNIKKKNGKYVLVLNKLYYSAGKSEYITSDALGINKIYNFSNYDIPSENGNVIDMTKLITDYDNEFDKLKNRGNQYRYTFSKNGKNYILEKYEIVDMNSK